VTRKYSSASADFDTKRIFSSLSSPTNEKITVESMQKLLEGINVQMTDAELTTLIKEFDDDGDGALSIEEFKVIMDELAHI
jgi:Ca2+-binding EF-hand superfamily protein